MTKLSAESFARAKNFIKENARPLDRRVFEYYFENGTRDAVVEALAPYQNADGGFGNALEPDFRLPDSSPIATTIALQVARQVNATYEHPLVEHALRYLLWAYDQDAKMWHAVGAEVNDYPHAPWWTFDAAAQKAAPESSANPTAEIVGYLQAWSPLVPPDFLAKVTMLTVEKLFAASDAMDMHDVLCYMRLADEFTGNEKARVVEKLSRVVSTIVAREPAQWDAYGPQPLLFAPTRDSPFVESLRDALDANLDYKVAQQSDNGGWSPNWSWGDTYPAAWQEAQKDWQGNLTVDALKSLKAFGKIE